MAASTQPHQLKYGLPINDIHDQLPGGACNFRELSKGTKSPVCGCKRFWLNVTNTLIQPGAHDNAWCFCGHHACFHNAVSQQVQRLSSQQPLKVATAQSVDETVQRGTPEGYVSVQQAGAVGTSTAGLGICPDTTSQSQSINARIWNALNSFARAQDEGIDGDSVRQPSTTASFNGEIIAAPRPMDPPLFIPNLVPIRPSADEYPASATEVATPSVAGTPDLRALVPFGSQARQSPLPNLVAARSPKTTSVVKPSAQDQADGARQMPPEEVMNLLKAHGQRLAALEGLSFSHIPVEEVQDKFEFFDSRLLDLEQWRGDVEERTALDAEEASARAKQLPRSRKRRLLPAETSSFASDESFDMTAAAHAEAAVLATIATNAEIGPRIDDLEGRIADLERLALPTHAQPWVVEVVLLPWGRDLRGIWFSAEDATQHSMRLSQPDLDEWTSAQSQLKTSFRSSSSHGAWTTESIQAWAEDAQDWLSAKACGPAGNVFQRLAGRGFVRSVTFKSADSNHICETLAATFGDLVDQTPTEAAGQRHFALQQPIIPLRKVRKSTRLRFLTPAEMITPAVWTARALESSILMRVGENQRRMYVTTPHAYLQGSYDGWSWSQIRKMPARDASGEVQPGQIDPSVAIEACWSYNDRLDRSLSIHASFASHQSTWSTKSQQSSAAVVAGAGQLTPALSGSMPNIKHNRSTSLPGSASGVESIGDSLPKRQVASFEAAASIPTLQIEASKRRRLSSSQEAIRQGVNFTPRWSREPPSPFHSEHATDIRSQAASSSRKRGDTPFAYATPHSNAHVIARTVIPGDGDTEHDSDDGRGDEEEWHGMDVAASRPDVLNRSPAISGTSADGDDDDDDDLSLDGENSLYEDDDEMDE